MSQLQEDTSSILYTIVTILFALSLISERVANLYKLYWPNLRIKQDDTDAEKLRERKVMWTALVSGWIVAAIAGADLFSLINGDGLFRYDSDTEIVQRIPGIFLSGIFISMGSKFWHDLLDIVLQFSNLKKYQVEQAVNNSENTAASTLAVNMKLAEPKLKALQGYAGYDVAPASGKINLKFDNQYLPSSEEEKWIHNMLGKENVLVVSSNIKL